MDYVHRAEREAQLARAIAGLSSRQRISLLRIMGDPPKLENVPPEYWNGQFTEWMGVMTPELESIFVDSAELMIADFPGLGVDWNMVNQSAADWARRYGSTLVRDIDARTLQGVRDAVGDFYEQGLTLGQLREKLGRWYGPNRASTLATTETTRAAVEGERGITDDLARQGIVMVEVWQTNNDELVCPLCGPHHGKTEGDGWTRGDGPPAHPNCRCWTTHELPVVAP